MGWLRRRKMQRTAEEIERLEAERDSRKRHGPTGYDDCSIKRISHRIAGLRVQLDKLAYAEAAAASVHD